ncbi:MAG: cyclopropane fatty acyl phospholipid synthase [Luteimonas sp.]
MPELIRNRVLSLLESAGIHPGGPARSDPVIHDQRFFGRVLSQGSLGLGESYMEGWWDVESLDDMIVKLLGARLDERVQGIAGRLDDLRAWLLNLQSARRAREVGRRHYDIGNDLFHCMLGRRMVYSCGYWRDARDLDAAQEAKLDLVCRKLGQRPGMRVLDIGCGWGEALEFAARRYGVSGVGVTISREQAEYARRLCDGLPVEIRLQDYRELHERFDRVFSIGMFEHVGVRNYRNYFEVARRCLVDEPATGGGLFLLHSIGSNWSQRHTDPWIGRYIFPNSMLPSAAQIAQALEDEFVIEDWHGFGTYYDVTLQAWRRNIEAGWNALPAYDERFRRMWRFYLAASMAVFRTRRAQLWQLVLSPRGVPGGYVAHR